MKKIVLLAILVISMAGCSSRDIELWKESGRRMENKSCYRDSYGNFYCED